MRLRIWTCGSSVSANPPRFSTRDAAIQDATRLTDTTLGDHASSNSPAVCPSLITSATRAVKPFSGISILKPPPGSAAKAANSPAET